MTAKKDFKRRVRERMAKTGESYTAARAQVMATAPDVQPGEPADELDAADDLDEQDDEPAPPDEPKPKPFDVEELVDATEAAQQLGLRCEVLVSSWLAERLPPARILE